MGSLITKILLIAAVTSAIVGLGKVAISSYANAAREAGYAAGVADTNAEALRLAAKKQIADQEKIDDIKERADAEIAARTASNVKKALDDARKADPDCSATVPRSVLDALKGTGK